MTQEEFIKVLKKEKYSYEIEGDKIVVTDEGNVNLRALTTLPSDVKFVNKGYVSLDSLTTLPAGVKFENRGDVDLHSLTTLPAGVKFENRGAVYLDVLVGGYFNNWSGNIKGIASKRLLNLMISKGIFER